MKRSLAWLVVLMGVGTIACSAPSDDISSVPETVTTVVTETRTVTVAAAAPSTTPRATVEATAASTTTTRAAQGPRTAFGDGTFVVGADIAPGTYSTTGPRRADQGMCAFAFLPYKGAGLDEAAGGNSLFGPGYMQVDSGEIVQTVGCNWTLDE